MPRRTKEAAEKTRARILASALSLFAKKGYEHTTFTDIAARLKLTKGAVYWHFDSKEALLVALLDEMIAKFHRELNELMPKRGLTFRTVAETMTSGAERMTQDPKGAAFFLLLQTQIKWGSDTMSETRQRMLSGGLNGPYHCFIQALQDDIRAGRVREGVNPIALATVCLSIWTGLVRSRIEKFLECDLRETLTHAYEAIWESIRVK